VRHEVFLDGEKTSFTPKEYELLRYFLIHRGKMLTHKQILKDVWGPAHGEDMQYLRVYISQLREKIEAKDSDESYIMTEPGIGYRMEIKSSEITMHAKTA
jgi:two-component system KDP operon response regulator KdpE